MPMRAELKELFDVRYMPADTDDFTGALLAQLPKLDILWGNGTGTGQFDEWWTTYQEGLPTAQNDDWDLRALTGGPKGNPANFAEVRAIFMFSDTDLTLTVGAANPWTALGAAFTMKVFAGEFLRIVCPTDGKMPTTPTDKVLRVTNASGATATYSMLILGTTA